MGPSSFYGAAVPVGPGSGNQRADTYSNLTYLLAYGLYTAPVAETITLNQVNLGVENGGSVTPFLAQYVGGPLSAGASFQTLLTGDSFTVPTGNGQGVLVNSSFDAGGVNPTLSLAAGEVLAAGFWQTSTSVVFAINDGSPTMIFGGDAIAAVGQSFANPGFYFTSQDYRYDIGFTVGAAGGVPEPASWALMLLGVAGLGGALRAKRSADGVVTPDVLSRR